MMKNFSFILVLLIGIALMQSFAAPSAESKDKYPSKPITLVVPASAGGSLDLLARKIGSLMEKDLGVPIIIVYKPGASCAVGLSFVQGSSPDGYTFGGGPIEVSMLRTLGYASVAPEFFTFLARVQTGPAVVTVNKNSEWNTIEEFFAYAKNNPMKVKVGNGGTGNIWHMAALGFEEKTGVKFNHVPFDGAAPAVAALMGGHVDVIMVHPIEVLSGINGGRLKALAVMGDIKSEIYPSVPTLKERGIDYSLLHWSGYVAPKGLPDDVRAKLENALKKAIESDDFKDFALKNGLTRAYMPGKEFEEYAKQQEVYFKELIPKTGIIKK